MKRVFTSAVASILLASMFFASCSNIESGESEKVMNIPNEKIESYATFGKEVAKALDEALTNTDENGNIIIPETQSQTYTFADDETSAEYLLKNNVISKESAEYISRIENVMNDEEIDVEETIDAITQIEAEAIENLAEKDSDTVLKFAEVSKSALDTITDGGEESRGIFKKLKKAVKVAVATAVGATVGAAIGVVSGAGVGSIPGAVVGGIVGGVVSGAATAASGNVTIAA